MLCFFCCDSSSPLFVFYSFFFNDTATTEIYTLSLHDALPIWQTSSTGPMSIPSSSEAVATRALRSPRSEEHTSELQSQSNLVCRLLLEKKKVPAGENRLRHRAAEEDD